jgi:hypothetical protein
MKKFFRPKMNHFPCEEVCSLYERAGKISCAPAVLWRMDRRFHISGFLAAEKQIQAKKWTWKS